MKTKSILILPIVLLLSCYVSVLFADKPSFQGLGDLEGKLYRSSAYAVSADGSAVAGSSDSSNSASEAFRWTASGGMQGLGELPGGSIVSSAFGISANGSVVVGDSETGYCQWEAFRWTESGGMQSLGDLGGTKYISGAKDVSADGAVVVGSSYSTLGKEAFRWTESDGMVGLGDLPGGSFRSFAEGVSADGLVVVGWSESALGIAEAFRWTESEGMQGLGFLPSLAGLLSSGAGDISADGSVVVGSSTSNYGLEEAFRWTESGGMLGLGYLPGDDWRSSANAVSADGSVVVGWSMGFEDDYSEAFIWDEVHGMQDLKGLLVNDFGLDLAGWTLYQATGISDDGMTIVGTGLNPDGYIEGWIAVLPKPEIIYVDDDAAGANDGSSWADAYNYLQDALAIAWSGDEIRVAQGIYKPDDFVLSDRPNLGREETFQLINGVTLEGGYAGLGQPDPNDRDVQLYETILSGDLNGDDVEVANPADLLDEPTRGENSYHVVTASGTDSTAISDGFTITSGNASVSNYNYKGGGMLNEDGSPTVTNCRFTENSANGWGGGMCNIGYSYPTLTNCNFSGNTAEWGGGMGNHEGKPKITNCIFSGNSATGGAGMYNHESSPTVTNCTFSGNSSVGTGWYKGYGGGMSNFYSSAQLVNCTFTGNRASLKGGAVVWLYPTPFLNLVPEDIIYTSTNASNIPISNFEYTGDTNPMITNCIFWNNKDRGDTEELAQIHVNPSQTTIIINYNCVQGWTGTLGGTGNIGADPCFVVNGYWDPNTIPNPDEPYWLRSLWIDGDYHLLADSPCIDSGDPNYVAEPNETDLDGNPRVINGRIDMGAYEYVPPIPAEVDIDPNTLNLTSKGTWITAFIWLPEEYNVADIDPNSIFLEGDIEPERFWLTEDNQIAMAKFDREQIQAILNVGEVELTITGRLTDGTIFEATDIIKVIDKGGGKPGNGLGHPLRE